jgi:hypothetical protein
MSDVYHRDVDTVMIQLGITSTWDPCEMSRAAELYSMVCVLPTRPFPYLDCAADLIPES